MFLKKFLVASLLMSLVWVSGTAQRFNFVYVSDSHYGIHKDFFRGDTNVSATVVNKAMVEAVNSLSLLKIPNDSGVLSGEKVGFVDFVLNGGDIANRMQGDIQSAADSWREFEHDFIHGLTLEQSSGIKSPLFFIPGNHDVSNAIGHPKIKIADPTAMVQIYNRMMKPETERTNQTFNYKEDKVRVSFNRYGVHFQFVNMWPDSAERVWMKADLDTVSADTPVLLITHDEPEVEAKHFTNPKPPFDINTSDKYENLLEQRFRNSDGSKKTDDLQNEFAQFIKLNPKIKAYFHGNYNWNEFYDYRGPDEDISLPVFRVDSPMKGEKSAIDETYLSFILVSIDMEKRLLTARECFYNKVDENGKYPVVFGAVRTIKL